MEQLLIEKPFTDPDCKYTVLNSKEKNCFEVHNLVSGKTYIVNPFIKICDCADFQYRTNGGTCKHIEFLQTDKRIIPLLEKYNTVNSKPNTPSIPSPTNDDSEGEQSPFAIMERHDENQIMEELQGNVIKEYLYDFQQNGHRVTGLSYAGVVHVALKLGHIHTGEPIIQEMNGGYLAKVPATDMKRNVSTWGVSFQSQKMTLKDGREIPDKFAIQKVVAKASRNAMRHLFPEKIIISMIQEWQKHNGGKRK